MEEQTLAAVNAAAFVPLHSGAREFIHEVSRLARTLGWVVTFLHSGEDSQDIRETLTSLFPDGSAPSPKDIYISESEPKELIPEYLESRHTDLVVLGPMDRALADRVFSNTTLVKLMRDSTCSFLILNTCSVEKARFRRIVCGINYDDDSVPLIDLAARMKKSMYADSLVYAHEVPSDLIVEEQEIAKADADGIEDYMLKEFIPAEVLDDKQVETVAATGVSGEGLIVLAGRRHADIVLMSAPPDRDDFWKRLLDSGNEPYLRRLPCALLIYRNTRST